MSRRRIVAAVLCLVAFACASMRAEENPRRKPTIVLLSKAYELDETARILRKLFPAKAVIVPLADEHALLVHMTEKELAELRVMLRTAVLEPPAKSEPKMPPPMRPGPVQPVADNRDPPDPDRLHAMYWKDGKWEDVLDWYAAVFKLKRDVQVKPKGTFTFAATPAQRKFTPDEITDILNESLMQQKLLLIRDKTSFMVAAAGGEIDPKFAPAIELNDLAKHPRTALVEVAIPLPPNGGTAEDVAEEFKKLLSPWGEVLHAKGKWVLVRDTVGNILRIREVISSA